ncbi:Transcriptional regulatory protein CreB [Roseibium aggregatum]|uniref:Transcriptional regulatory protein CreB n=2 Tax=Roseibium aggregatum TaxID=187304 RepID=A0A0M6Y8S5_9HYPH|nr:Transcriptional regulatory protein CreB [Roseibium aggregatum]
MIMNAPSQAETVLLVDDTPSSLGMLSDALEEAGFTVLVAQSGRKAIEIAARVIPNAILMDAIMPELDGFETSKRLKALEDLRDVPVLFMTGLSETEHIVRGLESGGVDYVTKPVNPDELIARLRVHISNARNSRSAHVALDASGRYLMSVDLSGAVCWATPQASALLGSGTAEDAAAAGQLPEAAVDWLRHYLLPQGKASQKEEDIVARIKGRELRFTYAGNISAGEHLLRVSDVSDSVPSEILKDAFDLTEREAEVLIWIANGKSNKEIASILDMSPRTVNKHLDRIFGKLGVENRTSAAVVSLRRILEG